MTAGPFNTGDSIMILFARNDINFQFFESLSPVPSKIDISVEVSDVSTMPSVVGAEIPETLVVGKLAGGGAANIEMISALETTFSSAEWVAFMSAGLIIKLGGGLSSAGATSAKGSSFGGAFIIQKKYCETRNATQFLYGKVLFLNIS